jgi:hypothetical protein
MQRGQMGANVGHRTQIQDALYLSVNLSIGLFFV